MLHLHLHWYWFFQYGCTSVCQQFRHTYRDQSCTCSMSSARRAAESVLGCRSQRRTYCVGLSCWHLSLSQQNKDTSNFNISHTAADWHHEQIFCFMTDCGADLSGFCILWGGSSSSPALHSLTSTAPSSWSTRPCRHREGLKQINVFPKMNHFFNHQKELWWMRSN